MKPYLVSADRPLDALPADSEFSAEHVNDLAIAKLRAHEPRKPEATAGEPFLQHYQEGSAHARVLTIAQLHGARDLFLAEQRRYRQLCGHITGAVWRGPAHAMQEDGQ